jgi:hypothetical protein
MGIKLPSVMTSGNFFSTRHSALRLTMSRLSGSLEKHFEGKGFRLDEDKEANVHRGVQTLRLYFLSVRTNM